MNNRKDMLISRRGFARRAALVSANATLLPIGMIAGPKTSKGTATQLPDNFPKLSPEGQAEAESRYQMVLSKYASRLTEAEKNTARMACFFAQPGLQRLREFPLTNGDIPALFLKPIVEREKTAPVKQPSSMPTAAAKKS